MAYGNVSINILVEQFVSYLLSFGITVFFIYSLQPIAVRLALVDNPGGRKQHSGQVPLIGGIAMFLGFSFAILSLAISLAPYRGFLAACILLVVVGVLDDLRELSARSRLWAQLLASLMMVFWSGSYIHSIGNVFAIGPISLAYLAIPFTIFATVAAINAVNMIDGVDGLAGSVCLTQLIALAILLFHGKQLSDIHIILLLIVAVVAFLCFNFPWYPGKKARVFMGDSGSMFLGFAITWFLIKFSQPPQACFSPITILWILSVPVFDIITVTFRRLLLRKLPTQARRDHLHHLLRAIGFNTMQCSLLISLFSALLAAIGVLGTIYQIEDYIMFSLLLMSYLLYLIIYIRLSAQTQRSPEIQAVGD